MLPVVNGEFRVAADPNLRFAASGVAVCNVRAVASSRKKDDSGEWVDDKTCWVNITGFKKIAENMAESLEKGDLVIVVGKISTDDWEDNDGNKRTSINIVADFVGPALTFNPARPIRGERSSGSTSRSSGGQAPDQGDPWVSSGSTNDDEPPF